MLVRPKPADPLGDGWLGPGDLLVFEVVDPDDAAPHLDWAHRGQPWPATRTPASAFRDAAAEPRRAQVVRLTAVEPIADPLLGSTLPLFRVRWRRRGRARPRLSRSASTPAPGRPR